MPPIEILGWSLIHFLWQGAALYLVLWLALHAARRLSAANRYWLCCAALLAMFLCPIITAVVLQRTSTKEAIHIAPVAEVGLLVASDARTPIVHEPQSGPY